VNIIKIKRQSNSSKNLKSHLIALILSVLLIAAMTLMSGCATTIETSSVDINKYVVPILEGFDGYGSVDFVIDYQKLIDDIHASSDARNEAVELATTFGLFECTYLPSTSLKEGDSIEVSWEPKKDAVKAVENMLNVKFKYDNYEYVVSGLKPVVDYDPFENDLIFDANHTASGRGELHFQIYCSTDQANIVWDVAHDGENGTIKNGDVLTLTIEDNIDMDSFTRETGLRITQTAVKYEVCGLGEYAVDDEIFYHICSKDQATLNRVIDDWVVSALNDDNHYSEKRTYELLGYMFYTNNALDQNKNENSYDERDIKAPIAINPEESMLITIYKIFDQYMPDGYYVFIGLNGIFSYDHEGIYINHGESLPDSFVYYEKETVRYNEKFGWGQNCEPMGFLYNGIAYAGHMNVQETLQYLEETYGKNYKNCFMSTKLNEVVLELEENQMLID
jgi:hypothetical protein